HGYPRTGEGRGVRVPLRSRPGPSQGRGADDHQPDRDPLTGQPDTRAARNRPRLLEGSETMRKFLLTTAAILAAPIAALAAEKPAELKVGITTFLTGSASVFGVPARDAAEIIVEKLNAEGGIGG